MKKLNWELVLIAIYCIRFWSLVIFCSSCSWQGQRHIEYAVQSKDIIWPADMPLCVKPEAWVKLRKAEWWSMRAFTWSKGVEAYNKTDFWETGAMIKESRPDPNAIEAAGTAVGNVAGAVAGNPLSAMPRKKTGSPFGNSIGFGSMFKPGSELYLKEQEMLRKAMFDSIIGSTDANEVEQ